MPNIRTPKWFKKYLDNTQVSINLIVFTALITGLTSFGLPQPPKQIVEFFDNYKWFKWIMLWLLIYQGGSGQNVLVTNIAFGIMFTVYNINWKESEELFKKYKKYLVIFLLPIGIYLWS